MGFGGEHHLCRVCTKSSKNRKEALCHYLSEHTDAARCENGFWVCTRCTKLRRQEKKYLVIRHYLGTHTGETPYRCTRGCDRAFRHRSSLLAHYNSRVHRPISEAPQVLVNSPPAASPDLIPEVWGAGSSGVHQPISEAPQVRVNTLPAADLGPSWIWEQASEAEEGFPRRVSDLTADRDDQNPYLPQVDEIRTGNQTSTDLVSYFDLANGEESSCFTARSREEYSHWYFNIKTPDCGECDDNERDLDQPDEMEHLADAVSTGGQIQARQAPQEAYRDQLRHSAVDDFAEAA